MLSPDLITISMVEANKMIKYLVVLLLFASTNLFAQFDPSDYSGEEVLVPIDFLIAIRDQIDADQEEIDSLRDDVNTLVIEIEKRDEIIKEYKEETVPGWKKAVRDRDREIIELDSTIVDLIGFKLGLSIQYPFGGYAEAMYSFEGGWGIISRVGFDSQFSVAAGLYFRL